MSVTALAAGAALASPAAQAAPTTFNPFAASNGFTIVSQEDVLLGNGELEGSVATFGSVSTDKSNFPVVHKVAGSPDYTVPQVDGVPVRILANQFVGNGNINVTNAGTDEGQTSQANAVAKLVNTSNIVPQERGGYLRLHNEDASDSEAGNLDLHALSYAGHKESDYKTKEESVGAYFPDLASAIERTDSCLASMYQGDLVKTVTVTEKEGMAYPEGFATDRPNVINHSAIAGKIIKADNTGGYSPTADAPLVIRVDEPTPTIGKLNFEGWNASAGADQDLARYILLDLSGLEGSVTIDGLELGAIWAPKVDLKFNSNTTHNGLWFGKSFSSGPGSGELHHHDFLGKLPCGDPTPGDPKIGTTVAVDGSADKVLPLTGGTVVDTVAFENLTVGQEYELKGEVRTAPAGGETGITATATFTPETADGTTDVTFEFSGELVQEYAGKDLVVYEYLYQGDELIAEHTDPTDEAQTFSIAEEDTPPGPTGSVDLGSVAVGSLGVGSLALGSLGSSGGDSSTGSGNSGSGNSSTGSLPSGSIGTGSNTGSDIDTGSTIDLGSNIISGSLGNTGSTGVGSVDLGSVAVGSLGVGSLALGSLGSSGGDSSTGSGNSGSGGSSTGSLPSGSIGTGSGTGSGSNGPVGSTGSGDLGSLGSLIPLGSSGSAAASVGSLAPLGSLALIAGSAAGDGAEGIGSVGNGSEGGGSANNDPSDPNGDSGVPDAPSAGEQGNGESAVAGGNATPGAGTSTNGAAAASAPSGKGGRIDAGLGANIQSATPRVAAGLALLVIAGGVLYVATRRRGIAKDDHSTSM